MSNGYLEADGGAEAALGCLLSIAAVVAVLFALGFGIALIWSLHP